MFGFGNKEKEESLSEIVFEYIRQIFLLSAGAVIAAIGLKAFLVPNNIIDGGIVGVSIMASALSSVPLGLFLIILNIPFVVFGFFRLGARFAVSASFGITTLAVTTTLVHFGASATDDPILAAVFGGVLVGMGTGLVIRGGGTLDGTEVIAVIGGKRLPFSVGEIVMFINLFILGAAGFVFAWDNAMYSLIAYFVAYKTIDLTVEGLDESRSVWIVSPEYADIGRELEEKLGRRVQYVENHGPVKRMLLIVVTRMEETRLKSIVADYDKEAFITISSVNEVIGRKLRKRK